MRWRFVALAILLAGCHMTCHVDRWEYLPHRSEAEVKPFRQGESLPHEACRVPETVVADGQDFYLACPEDLQR